MKRAEVISELKELGVKIPKNASNAELEALLQESQVDESSEPMITEENVGSIGSEEELEDDSEIEDESEGDETPEETPVESPRKSRAEKPIVEVINRKEQVAPVAVGAVDASKSTENVARTREQKIKDAWSKEEKVYRYIPLGIGEKKNALSYVPITVNGFRVVVPKGEQVLVPLSVAKIIDDSMAQTEQAGEEFKIDRDKSIQGVSIEDALS